MQKFHPLLCSYESISFMAYGHCGERKIYRKKERWKEDGTQIIPIGTPQ